MKRIWIAIVVMTTGLLFGMGNAVMTDVLAEIPQPETMVYDCRRQKSDSTIVWCSCLRGPEEWLCTFPIPKGRRR